MPKSGNICINVEKYILFIWHRQVFVSLRFILLVRYFTYLYLCVLKVVNHGPGAIGGATLRIYWPYELKTPYPQGKHLLYLMQPPVVRLVLQYR